MIYVGVDVGIKGAIAVLNDKGGIIDIFRMPVKSFKFSEKGKITSIVDIRGLKSVLLPLVGAYKPECVHIGIERLFMGAGSRGNGVLTAGINYGRMWAALELITPNIKVISAQSWQSRLFKQHGVEPDDDSKSMSITLASKLYGRDVLIPKGGRVPSDGFSDALLIGRYLQILQEER